RRLLRARPAGPGRPQSAHRRGGRGAGQERAVLQVRQGAQGAPQRRLSRDLTQLDPIAKLSAAAEAPVGMLKEFREFIARGNVVDLAVGVIIGAAFGKIVTSLVDDLVMPPIGLALGKVDFSQLKLVLQPANPATKAA